MLKIFLMLIFTFKLTLAGMYYFVEYTYMNFIQQVWEIYCIEYTLGIL